MNLRSYLVTLGAIVLWYLLGAGIAADMYWITSVASMAFLDAVIYVYAALHLFILSFFIAWICVHLLAIRLAADGHLFCQGIRR